MPSTLMIRTTVPETGVTVLMATMPTSRMEPMVKYRARRPNRSSTQGRR